MPRATGALLLASALSVAHPVPGQGQAAERGVAFVNVSVVPMDRERVLAGQTVIVRGDRIVEIGPADRVRVPAGATAVDGRGKYLMPGLAEMHAHIPGDQAPDDLVRRVLFLYLANGITTIRGMLGHPRHLALRDSAARGELLSPTIYTSGPSLNGNTVPTPEVARRLVEEQRAAGYDFLKIHPGVARQVFDTLAATAHRVGIRFAGHVPAAVGLRRALDARYASIDHLDGYLEHLAADGAPPQAGFFGLNLVNHLDESRIPALAAATRAAGVWIVPTQRLMESLVGDEDPDSMARRPEMRYLPPQMVARWVQAKRGFAAQQGVTRESARRFLEVRLRLIRALHQAGVGILLGSDAPQVMNVPGFSIHGELSAYVRAGLTPYQALETGTRNIAAFFDVPGEFGTVEVGRRADLILLEANPLADLGNVARLAGVMVRGRWLAQSEIRERLEALAATGG